jgi:predicted cation transporter
VLAAEIVAEHGSGWMNPGVGAALIVLMLVGPIASRLVEEQIEFFFLGFGLVAATLAGIWDRGLVEHVAVEPIWITLAVIVAGILFDRVRMRLDRMMARVLAKVARPLVCGIAVFVIAMLSSVITAVIAALCLVEVVGSLRLGADSRRRVTIAGCFAIGLGASLTPLGEPLSTLAADALGFRFSGLFYLLGPYVMPGILACSVTAGIFVARHEPKGPAPAVVLAIAHARETLLDAIVRGLRIYVFVAALALVSRAFSDLVLQNIQWMSRHQLYWANTISAAMDNATLVALEIHQMDPGRAREAIIALLVSGGMLVPGNIPNIVAAGALRIGAGDWASIGVPMGLALLGIYFAFLCATG